MSFSVTPARYVVTMIETNTQPAMTDTELEAWFAEAGLTATVVRRCPVPLCRVCAGTEAVQLADAA